VASDKISSELSTIMSDRDQIETIKERLDIVSVVQEYVPTLKKSGRNYFGICPFHQEKTPSFSVNSDLGLFKCFGCGEGGDVIKFIEKIEGLDFSHALENAAKRAGIELKRETNPQLKKLRLEKEKILEANKLAAQYYHYLLTEHKSGKTAREYSEKRKLTKVAISTYQLGFAPDGYENLKSFLVKRGYTLEKLVDWGLLVSKNGRVYDKFRNRLMFPIMDHQGDVVGFSGRSISSDDRGPKYLNSPETLVYNKSKTLYGLSQAKEFIRKQDFAVLVEGNIDIISSFQSGVKNIVAPLGTALTLDQLALLKRYCSRIYLSFDTDSAGQRALLKSLELAEKSGLQTLAVDIGKYKDVDELITSGGDWGNTVTKAKPVIDYLLAVLASNYDLKDSKQKSVYAKQILAYISKVESDLEKADYLEKLSKKSQINREVLIEQLKHTAIPQNNRLEEKISFKSVFQLDEETYLLALLIQHPQWCNEAKEVDPSMLFENENYRTLFQKLLLNKKPPEALMGLFNNIKMSDIDIFGHKDEFRVELKTSINRIRKGVLKREIFQLSIEPDTKEALEKLKTLTKELSKIQ
jgi:DNA primase